MQTTQQTFKIQDLEKKDNMLEIVSDKYCRTILEVTKFKPKSATEITSETKIPISTVYRRIQTLHDNKLLAISWEINWILVLQCIF
ncbi:Putative transcription regulator [Nitrosopumilus piranensis]|uniref:Transcription regulator n=1 Tax=Nitrosopumilus piranensis TaxID=1582439 RepID=A0A0C5BYG2_9ARCH|nr:Putative transcription regulator [Nitrosopumilus piranensis]